MPKHSYPNVQIELIYSDLGMYLFGGVGGGISNLLFYILPSLGIQEEMTTTVIPPQEWKAGETTECKYYLIFPKEIS